MSNVPTFEITIGGVTYDNSFEDDVSIDQSRLNDEFCNQAEKYAYYAFLSEKAKGKYEFQKFELEQIYARVDAEKRMQAMQAQAQNPKFKYTEKMCENEVVTDKRYVEAKHECLRFKELSGQLQQAAIAIAQRRDMLIQLGANDRQGNTPQRIMEQQQEHAKAVMTATAEESQTKSRRKPIS